MTTPPECRCKVCGICYHDHSGWHHRWESMTTPPDDHPSYTTAFTTATEARVTTATGERPPLLVDTEAAAVFAGRDVRVIYAWATEGRLTRHGTTGKGNARWNLHEIPPWRGPESGERRPPPPPVKPQNFQDRA